MDKTKYKTLGILFGIVMLVFVVFTFKAIGDNYTPKQFGFGLYGTLLSWACMFYCIVQFGKLSDKKTMGTDSTSDFEELNNYIKNETTIICEHIKTGKIYTFKSNSLVKLNGEWHECVIYEDTFENKFVRLKNDFELKFITKPSR